MPPPLDTLTLEVLVQERRSTFRPRALIAGGIAVLTSLLLVAQAPAASGAPLKVDCGAGGNLQHKINAAPAGSIILVKGACKGTFTISGKGLTLEGDPTATLNAQQAGSTLTVDAAGKTVHLVGLTVTGGRAAAGGGILAPHGQLVLIRTLVEGNQAIGASGYAHGGGIEMGAGTLALMDSRVVGNRALEEPNTGYAYAWGGGIDTVSSVTLSRSTVSGNVARATSPDSYAYGYGGGVEAQRVTSRESGVESNLAAAHSDTSFSYAYGGGMDVQAHSSLTSSAVRGNRATASSFDFDYAYGAGISAYKGGLAIGRSSVSGNIATSTSFTDHADARGGGIFAIPSPVLLTRSTVARNLVKATAPAGDASAGGGGIDVTSSLAATNSTIANNTAEADASVPDAKTATVTGGGVDAEGTGTISAVNATVAFNQTVGTGGTVLRTGGGLYAATLTLEATIVAADTAAVGVDCYATTSVSHGHNLIRHDANCLAPPASSDKIGVRPQLGELRNNGGPTQTIALIGTSPAINAIVPAQCAVKIDQRGVRRPQGRRCDIGAFERRVT